MILDLKIKKRGITVKANRTEPSLTYRKRYFCNKCRKYQLCITSDIDGICLSCGNTEKDVKSLIKKRDTNGYWLAKEIEKAFQLDYTEQATSMIKDLLFELNRLDDRKVFFNKEKALLAECLYNSSDFDEVLDDLYIHYVKHYPDREDNTREGINNLELLFHILEEAHVQANQLYHFFIGFLCGAKSGDDALRNNPQMPLSNMFSGKFFVENTAYVYIMYWERVVNLYSILFQIEFDPVPEKNSFNFLYKKLRKNSNFQKTIAYSIIGKIKNCGKFNEVDDFRKTYTHSISPQYIMVQKQLQEMHNKVNNNQNLDYEFTNIMKHILSQGNEFIEINKEIANIMHSQISAHAQIVLPPHLRDFDPIDIKEIEQYFEQFLGIYIEELDKLKKETDKLIDYTQIIMTQKENNKRFACSSVKQLPHEIFVKLLYSDTVFRLKEAVKCLGDSYNYDTGNFVKMYGDMDDNVYNSENFLYFGCIRLYACYDKIAKIVKEKKWLIVKKKNIYITDIIQEISNSNQVSNSTLNFIKDLGENEWFAQLSNFRNCIFHKLRPGTLNGYNGRNYYNKYIFLIIYNNCILITNLLNVLYNELFED